MTIDKPFYIIFDGKRIALVYASTESQAIERWAYRISGQHSFAQMCCIPKFHKYAGISAVAIA